MSQKKVNPVASNNEEERNLEFQQVLVRRTFVGRENGKTISKFEKLKCEHPCRKIKRREADTLNYGIKADIRNTLFSLYLLPDEEVEDFIHSSDEEKSR